VWREGRATINPLGVQVLSRSGEVERSFVTWTSGTVAPPGLASGAPDATDGERPTSSAPRRSTMLPAEIGRSTMLINQIGAQ
jgi:hypothetical protein